MAYISKINIKGTTYDIKSSYDNTTAENFADLYATTGVSYAVGDLVVYDGKLYECTTAITDPAGAWDSTKWSQTNVESEFKRIQTAKTDPTSSSTATSFIDTITQDTQGVITATKKGLPFSSSTPAQDTQSGSAGSASTIARGDHSHPYPAQIATARKIDGVAFNGSADIIHYGVSSSSSGDTTKTVACTSFNLVNGSRIAVKFTNGNTAVSGDNPAAISLNVNSTGAKAMKYRGVAITSAVVSIAANSVHEFIYDSTDDCYNYVGDSTTALNASVITSGVLPVTRGGTGNSGTFLGSSIVTTNADGTQLLSDSTISMEEFHALDGIKTNVTIQDQIDAITGGGTDHVRYINEVPLWAVAGQQGYQFTLAKVVNGYNSSTNPDGYKVDIGDTIIGKDGTIGVVEAKTGTEGNYTFTAYYKDKLNMLDATYTSNTETLNLVLITPQGNPT